MTVTDDRSRQILTRHGLALEWATLGWNAAGIIVARAVYLSSDALPVTVSDSGSLWGWVVVPPSPGTARRRASHEQRAYGGQQVQQGDRRGERGQPGA